MIKFKLTLLTIVSSLYLTGCLDFIKAEEKKKDGSPVSTDEGQQGSETVGQTPSDFVVIPDQGGNANGGKDNQTQNNPPIADGDLAQGGFEGLTINDQAATTSSSQLSLKFFTLNRNEMKLSTNGTCEGGNWEQYTFEKMVAPHTNNRLLRYSVQFKDFDFVVGPCYQAVILHDSLAPEIIFASYPTQIDEGATAEIIYDVSDIGTGVEEVNCKINDLEKPCPEGRNTVRFNSLGSGTYTFTVTAKDKVGNSSVQTVKWTVSSIHRYITQTNRVNDYKKVDILFIIDNSGSMTYEQKSMADRVRNFLSVIQGLDYKIAVTTTDPVDYVKNPPRQNSNLGNTGKVGAGTPMVNHTYYGDGAFIPIHETASFFIDSAMPIDTAQFKLGMTLQRPEIGSAVEQGINAAYRVVELSKVQGSNQASFFRDGAQFAVVLISDEDESANKPQNDPTNLINLISSSFSGGKTFTYHSIVTKSGDLNCKNTNGATYGTRYEKISALTGGYVGSVCETDYASQLTGIAHGVRDMLKTITLQCAPLTSGGFEVKIKRNGLVFSQSNSIQGVNINFNDILPPGDYELDYVCMK